MLKLISLVRNYIVKLAVLDVWYHNSFQLDLSLNCSD